MSGYALVATAALLWATLGVAARIPLGADIEPLELGFWRALFAGAAFAVHALVRGRVRVAARRLPSIAGFAIVGVSLFYAAYFRAVEEGGAALAAVLLYTAPAWVAATAALRREEQVTREKLLAVGLTMTGVALIALGGSGDGASFTPAAIAFGLAAGLAYSSYYTIGKRLFAAVDAVAVLAIAMPIGALALLPLVDFGVKRPLDWTVIGFVALVPTYVAYLVYSIGLARVEATRAATVATIEPVAAAVLAYLAWDEALGTWGYAGAGIVGAGVLVAIRTPRPAAP